MGVKVIEPSLHSCYTNDLLGHVLIPNTPEHVIMLILNTDRLNFSIFNLVFSYLFTSNTNL